MTTPSTEMAKRCIDKLSFQIFLIPGSRFHVLYILCLNFGKVLVSRELLYLLQVLFFFSVSMSTISGLLKSTILLVVIDMS